MYICILYNVYKYYVTLYVIYDMYCLLAEN